MGVNRAERVHSLSSPSRSLFLLQPLSPFFRGCLFSHFNTNLDAKEHRKKFYVKFLIKNLKK